MVTNRGLQFIVRMTSSKLRISDPYFVRCARAAMNFSKTLFALRWKNVRKWREFCQSAVTLRVGSINSGFCLSLNGNGQFALGLEGSDAWYAAMCGGCNR